MITKKNRDLVDTVVTLVFLFSFMVVVSAKIVETQSTNVVLVSNVVSHPWKTPILNEGVLPAYGCKQKYKLPPVWVCDWEGEHGEMQTYIYIIDNIDNIDIEHPTYEEWDNENNILPKLQTEE